MWARFKFFFFFHLSGLFHVALGSHFCESSNVGFHCQTNIKVFSRWRNEEVRVTAFGGFSAPSCRPFPGLSEKAGQKLTHSLQNTSGYFPPFFLVFFLDILLRWGLCFGFICTQDKNNFLHINVIYSTIMGVRSQ